MDEFESKIYEYVMKNHMIVPGGHVTVGVSGGADSMCLLFVLFKMRERIPMDLYVVHVHHGLRGKEADCDAEFVEGICRRLGVSSQTFYGDVKDMALREGISVEEAGRQFRYACFERVRQCYGDGVIAVAHHMDDQAETVLMNLFRGSGLKGLAGMAPVRERIVRPLLCVSRTEIEDYLKVRGISYRTDESNNHRDYTRNRIRLDILPYANQNINSCASRHICKTAAQMGEVWDYVHTQSEAAFKEIVTSTGEGMLFADSNGLSKVHTLVQSMVIRCMVLAWAGKLKDIEAFHVEKVLGLLEKPVGKEVDLPYGLKAVRKYDGLLILKGSSVFNDESEMPQIELSIMEWKEQEGIPKNQYTKWFDYDKIKCKPLIRNRKSGDYLTVDKFGKRKKLSRYMIDEKIPREQRDRIWLLADGDHVMWVIGHRISEYYKITEGTRRILEAKIKGDKNHGGQY